VLKRLLGHLGRVAGEERPAGCKNPPFTPALTSVQYCDSMHINDRSCHPGLITDSGCGCTGCHCTQASPRRGPTVLSSTHLICFPKTLTPQSTTRMLVRKPMRKRLWLVARTCFMISRSKSA
jgi:hypothetical protein